MGLCFSTTERREERGLPLFLTRLGGKSDVPSINGGRVSLVLPFLAPEGGTKKDNFIRESSLRG